MTPLLDTHVLLWMARDAKLLSKEARRAIERARTRGGLVIASITLWEVALLAARRRISINGTFTNWMSDLLQSTGVAVVDLSPSIAELATSFGPDYSKDPADQIIGATARQHGMPLITADTKMRECSLLQCIW
jgi:PIN domain nuclease of toxin-antitoxin system